MCDVQLMEKERLVSSLRSRTDSDSSASKLPTDIASHDLEQSVHDFTERAPLIESLQRELSSAQVHSHLLRVVSFSSLDLLFL